MSNDQDGGSPDKEGASPNSGAPNPWASDDLHEQAHLTEAVYESLLLNLRSVDSCSDAVEGMYLFLDGWMSGDGRLSMQQHLDDCADCYKAFNFEAELRQVIARKCRDEPPVEFVRRISAMIEHSDSQPPSEDSGPINL